MAAKKKSERRRYRARLTPRSRALLDQWTRERAIPPLGSYSRRLLRTVVRELQEDIDVEPPIGTRDFVAHGIHFTLTHIQVDRDPATGEVTRVAEEWHAIPWRSSRAGSKKSPQFALEMTVKRGTRVKLNHRRRKIASGRLVYQRGPSTAHSTLGLVQTGPLSHTLGQWNPGFAKTVERAVEEGIRTWRGLNAVAVVLRVYAEADAPLSVGKPNRARPRKKK